MSHSRITSSGLPVREYLHPVSLASLVVLALNDHWLKASAQLPGWLTGKLSDVAGMIFFPLLLTAIWNTARQLFGFMGSRSDVALQRQPHLTRIQLVVAIVATGMALSLLQFCPLVAATYECALRIVGFDARVTRDVTDLLALPALVVPWKIGIHAIERYESNA